MSNDATRRELANFLRSRRARIGPAEVGLPAGPRRRTRGLRREEVAVLAGVSPTWYTYLEQARQIRPSPEVLDSLARVLVLTEDERRYLHTLVFGDVVRPQQLEADVAPDVLVAQVTAITQASEYPVYALNKWCDLLCWNEAAADWYDDWSRYPPHEQNLLRWMLTAPAARERLVEWEDDTRDIVARWRRMTAHIPETEELQARVAELARLSKEFVRWWGDHDVREHRSRVRHFRHPKLGEWSIRLLILESPEFTPSFIVFHVPVHVEGLADR